MVVIGKQFEGTLNTDRSGRLTSANYDSQTNDWITHTKLVDGVSTYSDSSYIIHNKNNPGLGISQGNFEYRQNQTIVFTLPHIIDETGKHTGVFEQILSIQHTYNVRMNVRWYASFRSPTGSFSWLYQLPSFEIGASTGSQVRKTIVPERNGLAIEDASTQLVECTDFRQPIPLFRIYLEFPDGAPKSGELQLVIVRRK